MVDNEFMNKKKSNKCCIYHKPRRWDESDTDDTSSDEDGHNHHHHKHNDKESNNDKNKKNNMNTNTMTQTVTMTETKEEEEEKSKEKKEIHVTWDESVIDNEFMNKKKSNKCCIYHKPRRWDESDTEETDSSSDYHNDPNYKKPKIEDVINKTMDINNSMSIDSDQDIEKDKNSESKMTTNQSKSDKQGS